MVATVNDILATIPTETRQALMAQMVSLSANPDTDAGEAIALQSSNTDTSNGTLRIAMECAYAPFNWTQTTDANGAVPISGKDNLYASGYDVQVAKYIAAELGMALVNRKLAGIETLFLPADPILEHISSSIVKDVARHGGDVTGMVPDCVVPMLADALAEERQRKD